MSRITLALIISALILIPLGLWFGQDTLANTFSVDALSQFLNSGNYFVALLITLFAGFLTSLSPCVYPVIPITLSVIGARRYESALQGFLVSLSYVCGMVALYVGLGILFSSVGILFGSVYRHPVVLFAVAALFLFFALSMMGVLNWLLPDNALTRLSAFGGSGLRGAFLMGLVSGLIASPCTGPVLAFILTLISREGDVATGSAFMLVYGIGMGVPFLILGTFSSAISRLPKSGAWMNVVKFTFGIIMVGASGYFITLGAQALQASSSPQGVLMALETQLERYRQERIPVIVDFYADWCVQCKEIEEVTFKDPEVAAKMKAFKLIRVDLTNPSEGDNIEKKFRINGLPLIIFFDAEGKSVDDQKVTGFIDAPAFLKRLDAVQKRSPS